MKIQLVERNKVVFCLKGRDKFLKCLENGGEKNVYIFFEVSQFFQGLATFFELRKFLIHGSLNYRGFTVLLLLLTQCKNLTIQTCCLSL